MSEKYRARPLGSNPIKKSKVSHNPYEALEYTTVTTGSEGMEEYDKEGKLVRREITKRELDMTKAEVEREGKKFMRMVPRLTAFLKFPTDVIEPTIVALARMDGRPIAKDELLGGSKAVAAAKSIQLGLKRNTLPKKVQKTTLCVRRKSLMEKQTAIHLQ